MSRQAIKTSLPIKNYKAVEISNEIMDYLQDNYNIECCTLGSTGKKPDMDESGDIDIAVKYDFNNNTVNMFINILKEKYNNPEIYISSGFKIISFGYNYIDDNINKTVQVDLMFTDDLSYSKFMYHSPNYKNNESKFKGLYRTNLLTYIAGRVPTGIKDIYDENNNLTDYWKYTLTYDKGLMLTHKSYKGKKKLLKNPYTVKEDTKLVSKNINKIIKFILGNKVSVNDTNSFESLTDYIFSDKFNNKENLKYIISDFINDERHNNVDILKLILNKYCN